MTPLEIRAVRLELGFTQHQLAVKTRVSRTTILAWEKGGSGDTPLWFDLVVAAVMAELAPHRPCEEALWRATKTRRIDKRWSTPLVRPSEPAQWQ